METVNVVTDVKDIFWTIFIAIAGMLAIFTIIALSIIARFPGSDSSLSYTVQFVHSQQSPYIVSSGLPNYQTDKYLLEKYIEAYVTGDAEQTLARETSEFVAGYGKDFLVTLRKDSDIVVQSSSFSNSCGPFNEGYCALAPARYSTLDTIGTVVIDDTNGVCLPDEECYKESAIGDDGEITRSSGGRITRPEEPQLAQCGPEVEGVCSASCIPGRKEYKTGVCEKANNGETPICCLPLWSASLQKRGSERAPASIPVFFMGEKGEVEVSVG